MLKPGQNMQQENAPFSKIPTKAIQPRVKTIRFGLYLCFLFASGAWFLCFQYCSKKQEFINSVSHEGLFMAHSKSGLHLRRKFRYFKNFLKKLKSFLVKNKIQPRDSCPKPYRPNLPKNYKDIVSDLDRKLSGVPGLKSRAKLVYYQLDENNLRRWLDLAKFKNELYGLPVEDHIQKSVEWRESYDTCCIPNDEVYPFLQEPKMYVNGKDKLGRPILVVRPGLEREFNIEEVKRTLVYSIERAVKEMGSQTEQVTVIVDCKEVGLKSIPPVSFMISLLKMLMSNYPLRLGVTFVVNAARPINVLWKVISPALTERTREKVFFLDGDEISTTLLKFISSDILEKSWGGNSSFIYDPNIYLSSHTPRRKLSKEV